jgi:hypothetical protein
MEEAIDLLTNGLNLKSLLVLFFAFIFPLVAYKITGKQYFLKLYLRLYTPISARHVKPNSLIVPEEELEEWKDL